MPRATRHLLLVGLSLLLATVAVLAHPARAAACDCAGISTARALRQADAVFSGTVLSKKRVQRGDDTTIDIRFTVSAVYKGTAYAEQVVASPVDSAGCGLSPEVGGEWVIFAIDGIEGTGTHAVSRLVTSLCSGNLPTSTAPAVIGPPRRPLDGVSDRLEQSADTDELLTRGLAIAGIGALFAGALLVIGLAVLWRPGRRR